MKNYLYVLFNKLSNRYGDVRCFPSDGFAIARMTEALNEQMIAEHELCRVGSIDILTGIVEPEAPVRLVWSKTETMPVSESK